MLDKRYLTLISLASTNSFTQTAKQLFITQPAVSQQMRSLEIELQIPIILREHNKIRLTKAGLELTKFAKQTDLESQKIITVLQNDTEHLKMGCTLSLSSTILPKFIQQLTTRSNVVTTKINNTQHILQNIRDDKVDFGLIEGNFNKEEFDSFFVQKENFICVANNQITATSIEDLFNQTLLLREPGSGSRNIFENWLAVQNYRSTDFQSIIEIASPSAIVEFLKHNRGVSFMYESLVSKELKSDQLKKLDLTGFHVEHPINLVFLKNSYFKDTYREIIKSI
ncbi:MAG TPA: LysR family transcriptional regulator [Lactobacillus sp.]|nr:LysR family transcriptional regulator [Lactobacillus sp.]